MSFFSHILIVTCLSVSVSCSPTGPISAADQAAIDEFNKKVEALFGGGGDGTTSGGHEQCGPSTDFDCVAYFLCDDEGFIIKDGSDLLDFKNKPRSTCIHPADPDVISVCCQIRGTTATPTPLTTCHGIEKCVEPKSCSNTGQVNTDGSGLIDIRVGQTTCYLPNNNIGVCCQGLVASQRCGHRNYESQSKIQTDHAFNEAAFGEFPWQGIIFNIDENNQFVFKCGASLISHQHVLTAAHCVHELNVKDIVLRFGEWQVNSLNDPLPYKDVKVSTITVHKGFNPRNSHNNIAVLTLSESLPSQFHINNICLPHHHEVFTDRETCFTSGWGKDSFKGTFQNILKKIDVPYVERHRCQDLLRETRLGKHFILDDSFLCAGGELNKDACYGDGGGPLVYKNPQSGQYVLAGITAWGIGCGRDRVPGVYTDVRYFQTWIDGLVSGQGQYVQ